MLFHTFRRRRDGPHASGPPAALFSAHDERPADEDLELTKANRLRVGRGGSEQDVQDTRIWSVAWGRLARMGVVVGRGGSEQDVQDTRIWSVAWGRLARMGVVVGRGGSEQDVQDTRIWSVIRGGLATMGIVVS
jgi:hypothetical protein